MIYNMDDEKKNMRQHHSGHFSGGLTDEELMELIGHVEAEEMLHAPKQLKGNILSVLRHKRNMARKRQVFAYRAKVLVAMAAALTVLILMPDSRDEGEALMFTQNVEERSLEQMALERRKNIDANWERYLAEQKRGGIRGFFDEVNERIARFGAKLQNDTEQKTDTN